MHRDRKCYGFIRNSNGVALEKGKQYFWKEKENMMEIKPLQKVTWDKCSDNTKYITGVYEYLLSEKAVQEEKKVFSDIKKCIDHGYVVLFGKDWEKDWMIYGYDEETNQIVWTPCDEKCSARESLFPLLERAGFYANGAEERVLHLRPVRESPFYPKSQ